MGLADDYPLSPKALRDVVGALIWYNVDFYVLVSKRATRRVYVAQARFCMIGRLRHVLAVIVL